MQESQTYIGASIISVKGKTLTRIWTLLTIRLNLYLHIYIYNFIYSWLHLSSFLLISFSLSLITIFLEILRTKTTLKPQEKIADKKWHILGAGELTKLRWGDLSGEHSE